MAATLADRLWAKVDRSGGPNACWPWTGALVGGGYGAIRTGGRGSPMQVAHVVAYELSCGPVPDGLQLRHQCNLRRCCNPKHVIPGTAKDNADDRERAGTTARGARQGLAKLDDHKALDIYLDPRPGTVLAREYGVSKRTVYDIRDGKTWRHVTHGPAEQTA